MKAAATVRAIVLCTAVLRVAALSVRVGSVTNCDSNVDIEWSSLVLRPAEPKAGAPIVLNATGISSRLE